MLQYKPLLDIGNGKKNVIFHAAPPPNKTKKEHSQLSLYQSVGTQYWQTGYHEIVVHTKPMLF